MSTRLAESRRSSIALLWPLAALLCLIVLLVWATPASALEAIVIDRAAERDDIAKNGLRYDARGDELQVDTAPGTDNIAGRMSVTAQTPGTNPSWVVFALRNTTDRAIERWLLADRYSLAGSGLMQPSLDSQRIVQVTPSLGFLPERIPNDRTDIFRITIEPGQTVTYVVELPTLAATRSSALQLWNPQAYEKRQRDRTLFNGVMLGITGLIAIFMTAIFGANHKLIFPSMALIAWSVLAYLCVDFGFWHKIFQLAPDDNGLYRATAETAMAGSFVLFVYAFLRIGQWHSWLRLLYLVWIAGQVALIAGAMIDPVMATSLARLSIIAIAGAGTLFAGYLALRGQDRALALAPSWLLFVVWVFAAALVVDGRLSGEVAYYGLVSGLVAILILLSYSVTQFAFRTFEPLHAMPQTAQQTRALAVDAAGSAVWEWNARKDEIHVSGMLEEVLGLPQGAGSSRVEEWLKLVHAVDRDRLRLALTSLRERSGGQLQSQFRLRRSDGTYRWFELKASSVLQGSQQNLMCIGLLRDVTQAKEAHSRLVRDAVIDNLTGLPNRELFLDRLAMAICRAQDEPERRLTPTVLFIDLDRFKTINTALGLVVGDSMLKTAAKRLSRHIAAQDSLARIGGDQFAILLSADVVAEDVALLAERVRRSLRSPMKIASKEVVLTASIGIAAYDGTQKQASDLLSEAELAMFRAKRGGPDRIEIFKPAYRNETEDSVISDADIKRAIERRQFRFSYLPVLRLANEEVAGFDVTIQLDHPKLGLLTLADVMTRAAKSELGPVLALHLTSRVARDLAQWHRILPRNDEPLFALVAIGPEQSLSADFVQEIKVLVGREHLPRGALRLKIDEPALMDNVERSVEIVDWLRAAGAGVCVENFGIGFSSLAHLARLGVDNYQFDRTLLHEAVADPQMAKLTRGLVAMAKEFGRGVVAAGVETGEDLAFLRSVGCSFAQGTHFSELLSERDVIDVLETIRDADKRGERRGLFGARRSAPATSSAESTPAATATRTPPAPDGEVPRTARRAPAKESALPPGTARAPEPVYEPLNDDGVYSDEGAFGSQSPRWQTPAPAALPPQAAAPALTQARRVPSEAVPRSQGRRVPHAAAQYEPKASDASPPRTMRPLPVAHGALPTTRAEQAWSERPAELSRSEGLARLSRGRPAAPPIQAAPPSIPAALPASPAPARTERRAALPPLSDSFDAPAPTAEELLASIASMAGRIRGK